MALASTDPKVLMGQAKCFSCLTPHQLYILRTYLLALIAMGDTSITGVQALSAASTCFACLTYEELLAAKQYLMAVWLGLDTTKTGIIAQAAAAACDFACLTPKQAEQLRTYLLAVTAGVSTTAAGVRALEAAAKCFNCLESKQQLEAQVYLLSILAPGAPTTPAAIIQGAKCYLACVPPELHEAFQTSLFAQVASRSTPPCVTPTAPSQPTVVTATTNLIKISWTQPANSGSLITSYTISWGTATGVYTNSATVGGGIRNYTISGLTAGTQYFFVVKANSFSGCSSANSTEQNTTTAGSSIDPAVTDWAARTVTNGASVLPSNPVITAVDTFVKALKAAGVWTKLHMINMIAWDTTATIANNRIYIKTPLLVGCGIDPWREINGPIPDAAFTINGFTKPGAQYIDCFDGAASLLSNCIASVNSASIIEYMFSTSNLAGFDWGQQDAAGNGLIINSFFGGTGSQAYIGNTAAPATINQGLLNGYYCGSRTANNRLDLYFANSTHAHASIASDVTVNTKALSTFHTMPLQTLNNNGDISTFQIGRPQSFAALGDGLTSADSLALFNAIQALRTSFGGGFI